MSLRNAKLRANSARLSTVLLASALALPLRAQSGDSIQVGNFSAALPGGSFPAGWQPWILSKLKPLTAYSLVSDHGTVVVKATSEDSASGLIRLIRIDPRQYPIVEWRWKAANLVAGDDNAKRFKEDSPVRLYIGFDGDKASLPLHDPLFLRSVKMISGQDLPFATLNYIWENRAPADTVIANPNTNRVQMIVVESGAARIGHWVSYSRNVYEDYKRAFGEEPQAIVGVFLMTDTDNTNESATAYYGDIIFKRR